MKSLLLLAILLIVPSGMTNAQAVLTSAQSIQGILSVDEHRAELTRLNSGITTLLADARLTDQAARQTLQESQTIIAEMLSQKIGTNAGKLVDLAKWLRAQAEEKHAIHDAGGTPTPQQQFALDNSLAGQEVYLTSIIDWILTEYVRIDGLEVGASRLENYLQLYLNFRGVVEGGTGIPDYLLLRVPNWMQTRFLQLTADQKHQFFKDVNDARAERSAGPAADEKPAPPPTPQEQAAYEAAYQFIVNNIPQP